MTLTRLLEIKRHLLERDEVLGLMFAERLWRERGAPVEPAELSRVLETILDACQRQDVRYPPILLRRRKELQRGLWKPSPPPPVPPPANLPAISASPTPGNAIAEACAARPPGQPLNPVDCKLCGNKGFVLNPGGNSGRVCSCWQQRLAPGPLHQSSPQDCYTPSQS